MTTTTITTRHYPPPPPGNVQTRTSRRLLGGLDFTCFVVCQVLMGIMMLAALVLSVGPSYLLVLP
jgi:hypothetical protein